MLLAAAASASPKALWYLTRGTGLVTLVLLTITMATGLTQIGRFVRPGLPRFLAYALHRNTSLIAVGLLGVHIATAVLDSYAPIKLVDAFVPFVSAYRPIWLGLGALAFDLLVVLVITSLVRHRLGERMWRAVHWAAYACWPVAVVHGLGTGSDPRLGWVQVIYVLAVLVTVGALWWRLASNWEPSQARRQVIAVATSVGLAAVVAAWALSGPLRPGWAKRSTSIRSLIAGAGPVFVDRRQRAVGPVTVRQLSIGPLGEDSR